MLWTLSGAPKQFKKPNNHAKSLPSLAQYFAAGLNAIESDAASPDGPSATFPQHRTYPFGSQTRVLLHNNARRDYSRLVGAIRGPELGQYQTKV